MTNDETIKQLDSLLSRCKSTGYPLITANDCEALEAAIAALRPKGEPLTLEQLREMDGWPVWIVGITQKWLSPRWAIVDRDNCLVRTAIIGALFFFENYGRTWLAYEYPLIDRNKWELCELCKRIDEVDPCYKDGCFRKNAPECDFRCDKFLDWRADRKKLTGAAFCPKCGRPLTEQAWAELEKRLRWPAERNERGKIDH